MEKNDWIVTPEHERTSDSVLYVPGSTQILLTDAKHETIPRDIIIIIVIYVPWQASIPYL